MQNINVAAAAQAQPQAAGGVASVRFSVYNNAGNHAGKTVGQVREGFAKMWGIPGEANAFKGSTQLPEDYVIQPNDNVEFVKKSGEKG